MNIPTESTLWGWCKREEEIRDRARGTSSPHGNPTSPASSNCTEPVVNQTGGIFSNEDNDLVGPGSSKRRRMDNGVIDLQQAHQSTPLARSSRQDSSSSTDTASANINNTCASSSSSLFNSSTAALYLWVLQQQQLLAFSFTIDDIVTSYSALAASISSWAPPLAPIVVAADDFDASALEVTDHGRDSPW